MNTTNSKTGLNIYSINTRLSPQNPIVCFPIINYAVIGLVLLLCLSCTNTAKKGKDIQKINIIDNLSNNQAIKLSTIASGIEYVALETNGESLLPGRITCYSSSDHIVVFGLRMCYVFDRKKGNFVRQIGSRGQGTGEYLFPYSRFWDAENEQVCFLGNGCYLFHNIDGTLSHQTIPFKPSMSQFVQYEDTYVGYISNADSYATIRIAFFDKKGVLVDSIPNYRSWKRTVTGFGGSGDTDNWVYVFDKNMYYKDLFCDTLYQIKDFKLHPRYVFNTGGLAVPYELQEGGRFDQFGNGSDKYEKYMNITKILEDNRYMYIAFDFKKNDYKFVYDKKEGNQMTIPLHGFENDLDGGLPFWPEQMISGNEMMCSFTAEQLLKLDKSKITNEKLKNLLNNLKEDDNPVVAIVTLKE